MRKRVIARIVLPSIFTRVIIILLKGFILNISEFSFGLGGGGHKLCQLRSSFCYFTVIEWGLM